VSDHVTKQTISTFHKWVLALGMPLVVITPFVYLYYGFKAHDETQDLGKGELFRWTIGGEHVVDPEALGTARILLAIWIVSIIATIAGAAYGAVRIERRSNRDAIDLKYAFADAPYWSLGDRAGWRNDEGVVVTGTVVEVHRRPFTFGGERIDAVSGIPGLVMKTDADGSLVARKLASVYRLTGSTGASGTLDSIREAMNDAVQPGDEFAWIDKSGEPAEGVVVAKHDEPFEVGGRRIDASKEKPGYTVERNGVLIGITNALREG